MRRKIKKILIVDDEEDFLSLLKEALEVRGFEVITASNAVESGIMLATQLPSLILMDIKMAGINGLDACEAIKRNPATKEIPLVIISALFDESYKERARRIGVADYFVKPVNIKQLIAKLKEILGVEDGGT